MSITKKTIKRIEKEIKRQFKSKKHICIQNSLTGKYCLNNKEYDSLEKLRVDNSMFPWDEISVIEFDPIFLKKYQNAV
jgi:hypothetical protein